VSLIETAAAFQEDCSMASETTRTGSPMTVCSPWTTPFLPDAAARARVDRRLVAR
jgi:hypothetical protein